jgi:hypothetical protein
VYSKVADSVVYVVIRRYREFSQVQFVFWLIPSAFKVRKNDPKIVFDTNQHDTQQIKNQGKT